MNDGFYIVSRKHTHSNRTRRGRYITFWRPNNCGYCWPLSWAGKYSAEVIASRPGYYDNDDNTIVVPVEIVDALAKPPVPRDIDGDAGPVVFNTAKNWRAIRGASRSDSAIPGVG